MKNKKQKAAGIVISIIEIIIGIVLVVVLVHEHYVSGYFRYEPGLKPTVSKAAQALMYLIPTVFLCIGGDSLKESLGKDKEDIYIDDRE